MCPSQDIPRARRFEVLDSRLEFSNANINNWRTHIKMNVIIIPLAGHYRRFLFLFLCVNLFKRKKTFCNDYLQFKKINKPRFSRNHCLESLPLCVWPSLEGSAVVGLSSSKATTQSSGCGCWKFTQPGWGGDFWFFVCLPRILQRVSLG